MDAARTIKANISNTSVLNNNIIYDDKEKYANIVYTKSCRCNFDRNERRCKIKRTTASIMHGEYLFDDNYKHQ